MKRFTLPLVALVALAFAGQSRACPGQSIGVGANFLGQRVFVANTGFLTTADVVPVGANVQINNFGRRDFVRAPRVNVRVRTGGRRF